MKRLLHLCILALAIVASPAVMADDTGAWPAGRTFVVGFAQDDMGNDWRAAQVRDVRAGLAAYPFIDFVHTDAGGQVSRQILDIEDLAARPVDVLITSPLDAATMAPVIAAVEARGIPVILLSRRVDGEAYTSFVTASNHDIARHAARFLAGHLEGRGRILILQHIPTTTPGRLRTEGFLEELARHPGMSVAAMRRGDSLRAKSIRAVEAVLAEGIGFDAIYAQSDSMASGARLALRKAGIDPATIPTVGIDYIAEAREAIVRGEQTASFVYPTFGRQGADLAVRILKGETVPRHVVVDSLMVTRGNAAEVEPIF